MAELVVPLLNKKDPMQLVADAIVELKDNFLNFRKNIAKEFAVKQLSAIDKELVQVTAKLKPLDEASKYLSASQKKDMQLLQINKASLESQKKIIGLSTKNGGPLSPSQVKSQIMKTKITEKWQEFAVKNKGLAKLLVGVATIAKGITEMAGNSFLKILGFLLAMAIFDPSGKLLSGILNFFVGIIVWLINIIAEHIPHLIMVMIDIVRNVLPKVLTSIVQNLFPAIGEALKTMAENFTKEGMPMLGWIIDKLSSAFAEDGFLYKFATTLAQMSPILLTGFLIIGAIMKLAGPVMMIVKVLMFVGSLILKGVALLNPVTATILAIVATFALLWKFSDKVVGFFESIFGWFKKLNIVGKILIAVVAGFFWPITGLLVLMYGLAKFFKSIKQVGLKSTLKLIWSWITEIGKIFWEGLKTIFKGVFAAILEPFRPLLVMLAPLLSKVSSVLKSIWNLITTKILAAMNWVTEAFNSIMDTFAVIGTYGITEYFKAGEKEKQAMMLSAKLARESNTSLSDVADLSKGGQAQVVRDQLVEAGISVEKGGGGLDVGSDVRSDRISNQISRVQRLKSFETNNDGNREAG